VSLLCKARGEADEKYELDSLCGFLKITRSYYSNTKDSSFINQNWLDAVDQIMQVIEDQSKPSFDEDFNFFSAYNWTGLPGALSGPVTNGGNNAPKAYTGLVATHHRPSDDLSLLRESL
jgi:meiotically up-regulated gene 157 (Mug157) protein